MAEERNNGPQPADRGDAAQTANPAEVARRELIAWCEQHQLPVPDELPAQSSGR
jgi:hypothetical protein